jgi:transcriptional regulator with XRE-family HTH domain
MTDTLQSIRIKQGFTQADIAKKLGVTVPTVSSWERHQSSPSPRYIPQLADLLGKSRDEIFLLTNTTKLSKVK